MRIAVVSTSDGTDYPVVLTRGEDGYIVAECPPLTGCISQGATEQEALINIKEAIEVWMECWREMTANGQIVLTVDSGASE